MSGRTRTKTDTLSDDQKDVYDYDDDHDDDDYRVELKDSNHEENKNCGNGVLAIGNPTICPSICPTILANASTEICKFIVINDNLKLELVLQRAALVELAAVADQSLAPSPSQCNREEPGLYFMQMVKYRTPDGTQKKYQCSPPPIPDICPFFYTSRF